MNADDCPIVKYCSAQGISLRAFASRINRSPQALSDYVHGLSGLAEDAYLTAVAVSKGVLSLEELVSWAAQSRQWRREQRARRSAS